MRLLTLTLMLTVFCSCTGKPLVPKSPFLVGVDSISADIGAKDYSEVLRSWVKDGRRNRTVINVSPYDGLAFIPEKRLKGIKAVLFEKRVPADEAELVNAHNYLFTAAKLGLVNKVYWVIPFNYLDYIDAEERVRQFLGSAASYFQQKDIETMKFNAGCVSGTLYGIEAHICSAGSLPVMQETVALVVTDGFFPVIAATKKKNILGLIKEFVDSLSARRLKADSLKIVSLPEEPAYRGYLINELIDMFRNPDTASKSLPPDLWRLRDQADNMLTGGGVSESLSLLISRAQQYPDDPYLLLMRGTAELVLLKTGVGFNTIETQCGVDPFFCKGIMDACIVLRGRGGAAKASEILARILILRPDDIRIRLEYARTLYMLERYPDALKVLSGMNTVGAMFMIGDCYYSLGKPDEARMFYEKAIASYRSIGLSRVDQYAQDSLGRLKQLHEKAQDQAGVERLNHFPYE